MGVCRFGGAAHVCRSLPRTRSDPNSCYSSGPFDSSNTWVDGRLYETERSTPKKAEASGEEEEDDDDDTKPDLRERWQRRAPTGPLWPEAHTTAIRHATILTVTDGTISQGTILINNGRIEAVGPDASVSVPAGTREIDLFDLYRGEQVPEGKKSLAFRVTYRDPENTLTDKKVDKAHAKAAQAVQRDFGAGIR